METAVPPFRRLGPWLADASRYSVGVGAVVVCCVHDTTVVPALPWPA